MISFPCILAHLWSLLWGQLHQNAAGVAFAWFFIGGQSKACETRKADDADPEREHVFLQGVKGWAMTRPNFQQILSSWKCQEFVFGEVDVKLPQYHRPPQKFLLSKCPKLKTGCSGPWKPQMRFDTVGELSLSLHSCASSTLEASTALTC